MITFAVTRATGAVLAATKARMVPQGTRWGTPLEPRNLTCMFRALCAEHGIRPVRLHDLRHTCVSLLLSLGVHPRVVMEIVGHSAIEMTMNVYGHVNLETQRRALDGLDGVLSA